MEKSGEHADRLTRANQSARSMICEGRSGAHGSAAFYSRHRGGMIFHCDLLRGILPDAAATARKYTRMGFVYDTQTAAIRTNFIFTGALGDAFAIFIGWRSSVTRLRPWAPFFFVLLGDGLLMRCSQPQGIIRSEESTRWPQPKEVHQNLSILTT